MQACLAQCTGSALHAVGTEAKGRRHLDDEEIHRSHPDEPKPDEAAQQEITKCDGKLRRLAAANDLRSRGRRTAGSIDFTGRTTV